MKTRKVHIKYDNKADIEMLCGRNTVSAWNSEYYTLKIARDLTNCQPSDWCKTCKMVFNSMQTSSRDLLK